MRPRTSNYGYRTPPMTWVVGADIFRGIRAVMSGGRRSFWRVYKNGRRVNNFLSRESVRAYRRSTIRRGSCS